VLAVPGSLRSGRKPFVAVATVVVVLGLHAIRPAPARASICSLPLVNVACSIVSGIADGVKFEVNTVSGAVKDAVSGRVIAFASKLGCSATVGGESLGARAIGSICAKVVSLLGGKAFNSGGSSGTFGGTGGTFGGAGPPSSPSTPAPSNQPPEGTPASALSTAPMAALAGAATIFLADHVSSDTQVNLLGGWFDPIYRAIENYAWLLGVIALSFGGFYVMVAGAVGKETGLFAMLADVPYAALIMVAAPVLVMVGVGIIDSLCADLMHQFPAGTHMLHVMAAILGVLAGSSALASLAGHATIAHALGTAGWWVAAAGLVTSGAVALELIAREIAIYLTILILPLALIGGFFSPFAGWATALTKALFVVVVTKLVLAIGLTMAGAAFMAGVTGLSPVTVIMALIAVGLMTLFPVVVYGALLRVETAWHTTVSSVQHAGPQHSLARQVRNTSTRVRERLHERSQRPSPSRNPRPRPAPQTP
jgi:hypothetical protein